MKTNELLFTTDLPEQNTSVFYVSHVSKAKQRDKKILNIKTLSCHFLSFLNPPVVILKTNELLFTTDLPEQNTSVFYVSHVSKAKQRD